MRTSNLSFIRDKIAELPFAMMYGLNQGAVKLPSDKVDFVNLDDQGQLWFISHLDNRILSKCEQVFPVRLHFFKKEKDAFLEVSGRATIMSSISKPDPLLREDVGTKKSVLIKMTMNTIEYNGPEIVKTKSAFSVWREKVNKWVDKNFTPQKPHRSTFENSH